VCLYLHLSVFLTLCLSTFISFFLTVCLFTFLSVCLSTFCSTPCLPIWLPRHQKYSDYPTEYSWTTSRHSEILFINPLFTLIILNITALKDWWMEAFTGSVKRYQSKSLAFLGLTVSVSSSRIWRQTKQRSWHLKLFNCLVKPGVLIPEIKWSKKWRGGRSLILKLLLPCRLCSFPIRKYPTRYEPLSLL